VWSLWVCRLLLVMRWWDSGGCEEIFVAPREGEAGCEAASELKRSSSSFAKADFRLPGGKEGVIVAVEAIVEDEGVVLECC
jgi:hypothetical protein